MPSPPEVWILLHLDAVYRYARRRLSPVDAEDVSQQAFLALFEAVAAGRTPEDPGAYLLGVARRRVADTFRRRRRRPEPVPLPDGWDRFSEEELPDQTLARAELRDLVRVAVGFLPDGARSLLRQRYRDGVPVAELARRLDVTEKAVEMRLHRARESLGHLLREIGRDWSGPADEGDR